MSNDEINDFIEYDVVEILTEREATDEKQKLFYRNSQGFKGIGATIQYIKST